MQFLAFLKDSFREARSGWVLQAMMILAALLVLFVFSISFTQTTVKADLENGFRIFNWAFRQNPEFAGTQIAVENYTESNPDEPWKSDYQFDFVLKGEAEETLPRFLQALDGNDEAALAGIPGLAAVRDGATWIDNPAPPLIKFARAQSC